MIINVMIAIVIIINEPASTASSHTGCKLIVKSGFLHRLTLSRQRLQRQLTAAPPAALTLSSRPHR